MRWAPVPMGRVLFANSGSECERHRVQARALLLEREGPAGEEKDHRARPRLPRRDDGGGVDVGHPDHAPALRPADRRRGARRAAPIPIATRATARRRRSSSTGSRSSSKQAIAREGPDTIGRLHRRAGAGRRRRRHPAARLLRARAGDPEAPRHPAHRRRGDHRLRPPRPAVRHAGVRPRARHDHGREDADVGLRADVGAVRERRHLPDGRRRERSGRHLRPRLHLQRPSGRLRGGARDAAHLRERRRVRPCAARRAAAAAGPAALRRPRDRGRRARARADRRDRAGRRSGAAPALRSQARRRRLFRAACAGARAHRARARAAT